MSSFWANKLGQQQPQQPAAPAYQAPTQWWLPQPPVAPQQAPAAPPVVAPVTPQGAPPDGYGSGTGEAHFGDLLRQENYTPTSKAVSARDSEFCPSCGSNNYVSDGKPNSIKHCFDCGHNDRAPQSMSGMGAVGIKATGPPGVARMQNRVQAGTPGVGTIIGHV